jgi:anti-sigma B factor antagonist
MSFHALDGHFVVWLRGDLDLAAARRVPERLPVPARPDRHVVIDLSGVPSIDRSGVRALLACQLRARLTGVTFALACVRAAVRGAFALTGLDGWFAIYPTVAAALTAGQDPGTRAGNDGTDIVDLILADRTRIRRYCDELREAARSGEPARMLARKWAEVTRSIEAHLSATDEVCLLAVLGTAPRAREQVRAVIDEHEEILEVLREAGMQPPGSPSWWRMADEAMSLWEQLTEREALGVLTEFALRADESLRHRLGRQWRAFLAALDQDRRPPPGWHSGASG